MFIKYSVKKIKDLLLLVSVFLTGACVLIIEIIAIRILSPYYGNTIYTTSSVIGIVLAALSLGYYFGGRISDKYPEDQVFYGIVFISGFLTIFINILSSNLLPFLSEYYSISFGPLISSAFLFFIPAFSLGTLSPFAVKLHYIKYQESDKVGRQSGEVFFWSTIGSIVGSLLSGFFLIPYFGINFIIAGTGVILGFWGLAGFFFFQKNKKALVAMIIIFILELFFLFFYFPKKSIGILYEKDGFYEKISIEDREWKGRATRFLYQDKSWSSAQFLDSDEMAFDYAKYYKLYKLFNENPKNIFIIGGGAYSIPKAILSESKEANIYVSEIEPKYLDLAKKYFRLQDNPRLNNFIEDGRRFLVRDNNKYDAIISDVYYSIFSMPIHFTTKEFFSLAKSRLIDNGVFIGNFTGSLNSKRPSFILSEIRTFKEVFDNSYFFAVGSPDSLIPQNIIFLGINGNKKIDFESKNIKNSPDPIIADLFNKNISLDGINLSSYHEITDDFSPIEYLVSKDIKKFY